MFRWFRYVLAFKRRELIGVKAWSRLRAVLPVLASYGPRDQERLRKLANAFARSKAIEGAGGIELNETMRALIAVQACLPILNLDLSYYRNFYSVIIYPAGFLAPHEYTDEVGVVHVGERELSGESWDRGPVILSWHAAEQGARGLDEMGNVVIHEFAHKLDMLNGEPNGMPPLHADMDRQAWTEAFTAAYEDFLDRAEDGSPLPFDEYAASDPGEFFAVASEAFFIDPGPLQALYPQVYALLSRYYRQETLGRPGVSDQ
jgi:Mlc titration factor MtfA (ptsG expression regulator)